MPPGSDGPEAQLFALLAPWLTQATLAWTPEGLSGRLVEIEAHRDLRIEGSAPIPTDGDLRKVAGGAIVTGLLDSSNGSKAYGAAIVDLPIANFWAALNDETRHPGYTAVAYSELVSGRVCGSGRKVLQYLPVPMLADRWWIGVLTKNSRVQTASGGAVRELAWSSTTDDALIVTESGRSMIAKAQPIGFSRGAWFLVALDERTTYVEYYLHTDPGGRIPSGMASMFASRGVRENIEAIQRFAKEARPSCAIE